MKIMSKWMAVTAADEFVCLDGRARARRVGAAGGDAAGVRARHELAEAAASP